AMFDRVGLDPDMRKWLGEFYANYHKTADITQWSIAQCHIAAANMMTAAAFIGIDSCPIGGFECEKVREALLFDPINYEIALIIPFGYRKNPQPQKNRLPFDEVVEYR
ncbi:NAD(P)H-flavin nitroreductase, partial [Candidatus Magnetoovum chiemensis]